MSMKRKVLNFYTNCPYYLGVGKYSKSLTLKTLKPFDDDLCSYWHNTTRCGFHDYRCCFYRSGHDNTICGRKSGPPLGSSTEAEMIDILERQKRKATLKLKENAEEKDKIQKERDDLAHLNHGLGQKLTAKDLELSQSSSCINSLDFKVGLLKGEKQDFSDWIKKLESGVTSLCEEIACLSKALDKSNIDKTKLVESRLASYVATFKKAKRQAVYFQLV
ncbi:hypothetical protein DEO72_LG8g2354 [Vigna unguiculata]|uniref:Uncharacterized protein n=1 Tax=Vigna unguiculata TaxID=3917 RepID=A0A4D6MTA1_VIGUN|nr:hypothetical protein DEO72_LG8g2354 [Vigna unguiculata]